MKRINILIVILLTFLTIYLLYRLHINGEYNRMDYLLLMSLIAIGVINSIIILNRWKKKRENKE